MSEEHERYIDWKGWRNDSFGTFAANDANYFAVETSVVSNPAVRVLEVGFGNGAFFGWAHSLGVEIWGVEISPDLVDRANAFLGSQRAFADLYDPELTAVSGGFSHIVAFDVVEHIPQDALPAFLARLRELLAKDGQIVLRFPNGDSPFGRVHQHGDPTHVTTLGGGKIRFLAMQAGLRVKELRAPRNPLAGAGVARSVLRAGKAMARSFIERVVAHLYFGGHVTPFDPNYTAVLAHGSSAPSSSAGSFRQ
jgi:2-polyprenyl-3-methyl-5-hydroxy-6-metoxy-1,4-benzoquinol methylase